MASPVHHLTERNTSTKVNMGNARGKQRVGPEPTKMVTTRPGGVGLKKKKKKGRGERILTLEGFWRQEGRERDG